MKYIDADKLLVKIKGLYREQGFDTGEAEGAYQIAIKDILVIITSLQQEQPDFPTIVEQQKSAWSDEDENLLNLSLENLAELKESENEKIIVFIKNIIKYLDNEGLILPLLGQDYDHEEYTKILAWLEKQGNPSHKGRKEKQNEENNV